MHRSEEIVINTGPIIAITAALGSLDTLQMYRRVWVPWAVCQEILAGGPSGFAVAEFRAAHWLQTESTPLEIAPILVNSLDQGEAAVIQLALDKNIQTVCIDEAAEAALVHVMAAHRPRARVCGQFGGGKDVLPTDVLHPRPLPVGIRILAFHGEG